MTVVFKYEPRREWLHQTVMGLVWPDTLTTAAEAMTAEMPADWEDGDNWAAGPTLTEVLRSDDWTDEERREWEREWASAS